MARALKRDLDILSNSCGTRNLGIGAASHHQLLELTIFDDRGGAAALGAPAGNMGTKMMLKEVLNEEENLPSFKTRMSLVCEFNGLLASAGEDGEDRTVGRILVCLLCHSCINDIAAMALDCMSLEV